MTYGEAAKIVLQRKGERTIWIGKPDIFHAVHILKHGKTMNVHPRNVAEAVMRGCARSKYFKHGGYIPSVGWAGVERNYVCYDLVEGE